MIINPMFFYMMGLCNDLKELAIVTAVCSGIVVAGIGLGLILGYDLIEDDTIRMLAKYLKRALGVLIVTAVIATLIPSKETLIEMQIAKLTTTENVDNVITYVLDKVEEFEEGKANE